jgi:hypothetical protein
MPECPDTDSPSSFTPYPKQCMLNKIAAALPESTLFTDGPLQRDISAGKTSNHDPRQTWGNFGWPPQDAVCRVVDLVAPGNIGNGEQAMAVRK